MVLVEYRLQLIVRNANTCVPYFDAQSVASASATQQHAPPLGVLEGIGQQVTNHLHQQMRVASNRETTGSNAEDEVRRQRTIVKFILHLIKKITNRKTNQLRMNRSGFDLVNVQQRVQHAGHRAQDMLETLDHLLCNIAFHGVRERTLKQDKSLEWLAQVMTRRSQKSRLGVIGLICKLFGFLQ